ncbi:MAG: protein translocase subunit SecF [Gammaproteobacteria bacterium]|nr:protein translocase subunit SecF [Gammaproteobacteria bacterium]NNJ72306.1 protein translocase subunit SecF [Enterobacterales bacterium]
MLNILGPLNVDFLKIRKFMVGISVILLLISVYSLTTKFLNLGLDFTGGTLLEVGYSQDADLAEIRTHLAEDGFDGAVVQYFGSSREVTVRLQPIENMKNEEIGNRVMDSLRDLAPDVEKRRLEFVGPSVGEELTEQGGLAMLVALICIMVYVAIRFEWKFAVGSVSALAHDVIITLGIFSLLGLEFDLTVLAALLAVIGYSLNDTIVIYDRIRENFLRMRKGTPYDVINRSLNQTISRTIITSFTTIVVLVALFLKGGELIHGFATALLIGVLIGTYSSLYVASPIALALGVCKEDLMPPEIEKEGADQEPLM